MKKLFAVFAIFAIMFGFVGCAKQESFPSAIIGLGLYTKADGSIVQELEFSAQSQKLQSQQINVLDVMETRNALTRNVNKIREEFYISFLIRYSQAPNQEFKFGKGINITKTTYNETYDVISFTINFASKDAFNFYHPSSAGSTGEGGIKVLNPFLVKSVSIGQFPFSSTMKIEGQEITLGQRYLNMYNSSFKTILGDDYYKMIDTPKFVYDYGAIYNRMKSDANYDFSSGGISHHVWIKSVEELDNATIKLSVAIPNKGLWQLTFLCVALVGTFGVIIYFYIKEKRKTKAAPISNEKSNKKPRLKIRKPDVCNKEKTKSKPCNPKPCKRNKCDKD